MSYAATRPTYPDALFARLAALAPGTSRAWDCATGNGQAAIGLARWFDRVDATDASADQIANAMTHERIRYAVAPSEASGLADSDRKSTRLNSSHSQISYAVFCLKKKNFSKTTPAFDMIDSSVLELI